MRKPYELSEEELYKLERARDSIRLVSILFGEVQRPSTFTPQMMASLLELVGEDIGYVLQSVSSTLSSR